MPRRIFIRRFKSSTFPIMKRTRREVVFWTFLQLYLLVLPNAARSIWIWHVLDVAASAGHLGRFLYLGPNQKCPVVFRQSMSLCWNVQLEPGHLGTFAFRSPRHRLDTVQYKVDPCWLASSRPSVTAPVKLDSLWGCSISVRCV
jgi:hypothetical protein